jgi:TRAP-type mannitol/chloroaromatic compound transport system permease large subunit
MSLLGRDIYDVITNYGYTVFPLFILMGQIAFNAGIAVKLYDAAHKFIGHIPGGLAMATVMGATGFKAICGSSAATAATFASVAIPEMDRYGYDKRLSTGIVQPWEPRAASYLRRRPHHFRHYHRAIHRPAFSGWDDPS